MTVVPASILLDPGIKYEEKEGYESYDTGCEKDVWVQTVDGEMSVWSLSPLLNFFALCSRFH
jgi:hypothetical protein